MKITVWGARGTRPNPSEGMMKYGGNTSCLSIEAGDEFLILDAGSGFVNLGKYMVEHKKWVSHLFLSHLHWDHIMGIPFSPILYHSDPKICLHVYGEEKEGRTTEQLLKHYISPPVFPYALHHSDHKIRYHIIESNQKIQVGEVTVETLRLNHPDGCIGFRITYQGKTVIYATDSEYLAGALRWDFINFAKNADILFYDSQYTEAEYFGSDLVRPKKGFGHSTIEEALKLFTECRAKQLCLWHHDDGRTDEELDAILREVRKQHPNVMMAKEKMEIFLG